MKVILHRPCSTDGQCALSVQCPGQAVFVPVGSDFACIYAEAFACQRRAVFKVYGQLVAFTKYTISDAFDTTWNGDACQAGAIGKRIISDACDTIRNFNAF